MQITAQEAPCRSKEASRSTAVPVRVTAVGFERVPRVIEISGSLASPEDSAIAHAREYGAFAALEMARRKALRFPPWTRLAAIRLQGNVLASVQATAERLAARARDLSVRGEPVDVLGPAPSPIARMRGKERVQLVLRAEGHPPLHRVARALLSERLPHGVEVAVDIDPASLL